MEYCPLIYSRTQVIESDYRKLVIPDTSFCSLAQTDKLIEFMRAVINVDNASYGGIDHTRWSCFKLENLLLFGAGLMNNSMKEIDPSYYLDAYGRPIRSFIGIVIKAEPLELKEFKLVASSKLITDLFRTHVIPRWQETSPTTLPVSPQPFGDWPSEFLNSSESIQAPQMINNDRNILKVFPYGIGNNNAQYINHLLQAVISTSSNYINLVTGLNISRHALDSNFMNAVTLEAIEIKQYPSRAMTQPKFEKTNSADSQKSQTATDLAYSEDRKADRPSTNRHSSNSPGPIQRFINIFFSHHEEDNSSLEIKEKEIPDFSKSKPQNKAASGLNKRLVPVAPTSNKPLNSERSVSGSNEPISPDPVEKVPPPLDEKQIDIKTEVIGKLKSIEDLINGGVFPEEHLSKIIVFLNQYLPPSNSK